MKTSEWIKNYGGIVSMAASTVAMLAVFAGGCTNYGRLSGSVDSMHQDIQSMHQDIQSMRQDIQSMRQDMRQEYASLNGKTDTLSVDIKKVERDEAVHNERNEMQIKSIQEEQALAKKH